MKNYIKTLGVMLLTLLVTSCHDDSDVILSYANADELSFNDAQNSYAGKYKVFWKALNTNYGIWDYEKANGVDWDAHYAEFLPKFEALDKQGRVADSTLQKLIDEMVAPLHDGHLYVQFKNHQTGKLVDAQPGQLRNKKRADYNETKDFVPSLVYYATSLMEYDEYNSQAKAQFEYVTTTKGIGYDWTISRINELKSKTTLTEAEAKEFGGLYAFAGEMEKLMKKDFSKNVLADYNTLVTQYGYLNIPYLDPIESSFINSGLHLTYGLFNDGIAYFYISQFELTAYFDPTTMNQTFTDDSHTMAAVRRIREIWERWYGTVQFLHKTGQLKGVIIDVRNNPGGMIDDYPYALGSLLPKGGFQIGYSRYKRGLGRYDYSPLMPYTVKTLDIEHEAIDDTPVVVLANSRSISMSEATSLGAKIMPNARLIGQRTYGGFCSLIGTEAFSYNYSGHIGVDGSTPVYCYVPTMTMFNIDKQCLEGIGVTPDIEVALDKTTFQQTGQDTQLDRALEYIRTGK